MPALIEMASSRVVGFAGLASAAATPNYAEDVHPESYLRIYGAPTTPSVVAWNHIWNDPGLNSQTCWAKHQGDMGGKCTGLLSSAADYPLDCTVSAGAGTDRSSLCGVSFADCKSKCWDHEWCLGSMKQINIYMSS